VDSTSVKVCHNLRIHSHKVFKDLAQRAKNSMGWFFGFKLHFICNHRGEILKAYFTPANVDDRKGLLDMIQGIFGKVFADRGYISKPLMLQLLTDYGIELFTGMKKNMHTTLPARYEDMFLLPKRSIIETITDQLKNISQLEHSRHRSVTNFMVNALCALIAYCHQPKKPSLRFEQPFQLVG
jgi:IS5 family transposase